MRILLVGPVLFMPWVPYVASALRRLNQTVHCFYENSLTVDRLTQRKGREWAARLPGVAPQLDRFRSHWLTQRDQRLLRAAKTFKPDLILVLWGEGLSPELLKMLKTSTRATLATWWLDDPFRRPVPGRLQTYDSFFVFDRSYLGRLQQEGVRNCHFLPCACDETVYTPRQLTRAQQQRYQSDLSLVAWYYPRRAEVAQALAGLNLKIWGRGWTSAETKSTLAGLAPRTIQQQRFLRDQETCLIYNASKIGLNIHSEQTRLGGLNTRSFELPASGTFQLMDAVAGCEELLEPDQEVVCFQGPREAREKAQFYLTHEAERRRVAQRGRARVLAHHTYLHRMQVLLGALDALPQTPRPVRTPQPEPVSP